MNGHAEYLELAAAAVDFDLDPLEQASLDAHLATCVPCRRRAIALRHDARSARLLPAFELAPQRAQRIWRQIDEPRRGSVATMRLVAVAALLALLALSALAAGATLLRRDRDLSDAVTPPPLAVESPAVSPAPSGAASTSPDPKRAAGFGAETIVEIVVTDLRVRTEPTVDDARSAKLEPLLGLGTRLRIVEGPVIADDYEWYRVEAIGWPHRGWVAAADHDGEPWIEDPALRSGPGAALSVVEASLLDQLRPDAAASCGPRTAGLPTGAIAGIECKLSTALVVRVGAYRFGSAQEATTAYLERLSSSAVTFGSGDCASGQAGDTAWSRGDGDAVPFGGSWWAPGRVGCFTDQYGAANIRLTCGPTYIGVLGRTGDLRVLHEWAWQATEEGAGGSPPGICTTTAVE